MNGWQCALVLYFVLDVVVTAYWLGKGEPVEITPLSFLLVCFTHAALILCAVNA